MIKEKFKLMDDVVGAGGAGGKGGSGSSGRSAIEADDTLSSIAKVGLIDLLGEGAIGGLVDGGRSIEINGTPLMNASGEYNLNNVEWQERKGTPNQTVISGFSNGIESPHTVDVALTYASPYTFTVSNTNVDRVRVIIDVMSLMSQDTTTGDIFGSSVSYKFMVSTDGGVSFDQVGRPVNIKGKTKSKYQRSTILTLPKTKANGQPVTTGWQIRVVRQTADSQSIAVSNLTRVNSYVEIVDAKLNYANSALVYVGLDPTSFSSIPTRSYHVDGLIIQVPNNYNASTGLYSGVWNGGFQLISSSNPAWILYDLLTNRRYGLGRRISSSQVDKAMLYTIGRYCDELVSDGNGGFEKRFAINTQITQRVEAYKLISDIASVFRGMVYWNGGMACFKHDAPQSPTAAFTHANVENGEFHYASSSRKDRHSVINVTWNDPDSGYKQRVQPVEDRDLIDKMGIVKEDVVAFGCTSRSMATRVGRWILYSEAYESNFISFTAGLDASLLLPGEVIRICDAVRAGKRMADRITSATLTSVTTDLPVTLASGTTKIYIAMQDGSFAERTLSSTAGGSNLKTFSWVTPLPQLPLPNAIFALSDPTVEPMLARVVSVKQSDKYPGKFIVTTTQHNPSKYAAIEGGYEIEIPKTSVTQPYNAYVSNLQVFESTYFVAPGVIGSKLHISWEGASTSFRLSYRITKGGSPSNWETRELASPSYSIEPLEEGSIVDVSVEALTAYGDWTSKLTSSTTIVGKTAPPSPPTWVSAVSGIRSIILNWDLPSDIDFSHVEVYMGTTNNSASATRIGDVVYGKTFTATGLPTSSTTRYFWLKSVDSSNNVSAFSTPISGTTLVEADHMLSVLTDKIGESQLTTQLETRIGLVDAPASVAGSVAYKLAQEAIARDQAILTEQTNRQNADGELTQSINAVIAGVPSGFDAGKVWYFDSTIEGFSTTRATLSSSSGGILITVTQPDSLLFSPAAINVDGSKYTIVKIRLKRISGTGWEGSLLYETSGHPFSESYKKIVAKPANMDSGGWVTVDFDMSALTAGGTDWVSNTITRIRFDLGVGVPDAFLIDWVAIGRNAPPASVAMVLNEEAARVSGDSANATSISNLTATVNTKNRTFRQGTAPTATAVGDMWIDTSNGNLLKVWNGSDWVTSQDLNKTTTFYSGIAPTATATGDLWIDTANNNVLKRWNGAAWVEVSDTRISANSAAITTEATARVNGDSANANSISLLQTTVNGHTASISTQATSINGINAKYTVKIDNNGYVTGYGLISDSSTGVPVSSFAVRADTFSISNPNVPGPSGVYTPFIVTSTNQTIDGAVYPPGVYMETAMIRKLNASQIDTRGLSIKDASGNVILSAGSPLDYSLNITNKPTSISQINTQEGLLVNSSASDFSESFDGVGALSNWQNYFSSNGEVSIVTSSTSAFGGKVMRIGNNAGIDSAWLLHKRLLPFDPTRQYRIKCRIRRVSGTASCYLGFSGFAADGVTNVAVNGVNNVFASQHYHCAAGVTPSSTFTEYVGYTTGFGTTSGDAVPGETPSAPGKIHPNVRYLRPTIVISGAVAGQYEIDSFIVESISGANASWATLEGKPTSLSQINSSEGTHLSGIEAGATVGANGSNLSISPSGNMFPNSDFVTNPLTNNSWAVGWNPGGGTNYLLAWDLATSYWAPAGGHTIGAVRDSNIQAASSWFDIMYDRYIPMQAGITFELSGYLAAHRCGVEIRIAYYNSSYAYLSETGWGTATPPSGGNDLNNWARLGGIVTTPANTTYVRIWIRGSGVFSGETQPYFWATKIFFGLTKPGQTQLSPWSAATASGAFAETSQLTNQNSTSLVASDNAHLLNNLQQWSDVSGAGRPSDYATRNVVFRQSTQPTVRPDGSALTNLDLWFDTSTLNPKTYSYNGSSWVLQGDITANNISAGFSGQGLFATLSQLNYGNVSTYIANGAIGAAQIGSINLVGTSVFNVTTATTGARMDMDSRRIKVFDENNILRVQIGDLSV